MRSPRKEYHISLVVFLIISSFVVPYTFRSFDDNRLTSWHWVFSHHEGIYVFLLLPLGIIIAYMFSRSSYVEKKAVSLMLLLALISSSLSWGIPEVIIDSSRYFTQAKYLETGGIIYFLKEWGRDIFSWTDMPLMPFIYGLVFKFLGEERIYIQIINTLIFSSSLFLTYKIGEMLWDREMGLYGGLLLMAIPYLYTQIPLMLVDIPTMFFLLLTFFSFIKALRYGRGWLFISSLSISLAVFSKYSALLMLTLLPVIVVVHFLSIEGSSRNLLLRRALVIFGLFFLLTGSVAMLKYDVLSRQLSLLFSFQAPGLKRWTEGFSSTFFFQTHPMVSGLAAYSLYRALKERDLRYLIISWLLFLVFLFQIKRIRYIIAVFPMLTLMASYGILAIKGTAMRRFLVFSIVISSLIISNFGYIPFLKKNSMVNLKEAGEFINTLPVERVEIFTYSSKEPVLNIKTTIPILDLYINKKIIYAGELSTREKAFSPSSPLRFTWEYKIPWFYIENDVKQNVKAFIVVTDDISLSDLPETIRGKVGHYKKVKVFDALDEVFKFNVITYVLYD